MKLKNVMYTVSHSIAQTAGLLVCLLFVLDLYHFAWSLVVGLKFGLAFHLFAPAPPIGGETEMPSNRAADDQSTQEDKTEIKKTNNTAK